MSDTDKGYFSPHARYASHNTNGIRWKDHETGQEQLMLPVTIERFVDAGVTLADLSAASIVTSVSIGPYQPPEPRWKAAIIRCQLVPRPADTDQLSVIQTEEYNQSNVFDDRADAVAWAEEMAPAFRDAEIRDARDERGVPN